MSNLVAYAIIQNLSTLKEALDITGSEHDAKLNGYINRATAIIEAYCQRRFLSTTYTNELYSGNGSSYMMLRNYPVTSLAGVSAMQGDFSNPSWQSFDSGLFTLKSEGGVDRGITFSSSFNGSFPVYGGFYNGVDNYLVTYTAGYAADAMPLDLQEACIEIVAWLFQRRRAIPGIKSETLGKYSYTLESGMSSNQSLIKRLGIDAILDNYRTIPV